MDERQAQDVADVRFARREGCADVIAALEAENARLLGLFRTYCYGPIPDAVEAKRALVDAVLARFPEGWTG